VRHRRGVALVVTNGRNLFQKTSQDRTQHGLFDDAGVAPGGRRGLVFVLLQAIFRVEARPCSRSAAVRPAGAVIRTSPATKYAGRRWLGCRGGDEVAFGSVRDCHETPLELGWGQWPRKSRAARFALLTGSWRHQADTGDTFRGEDFVHHVWRVEFHLSLARARSMMILDALNRTAMDKYNAAGIAAKEVRFFHRESPHANHEQFVCAEEISVEVGRWDRTAPIQLLVAL